MLSRYYFSVQKLTFAGLGIELPTTHFKTPHLVKHPLVLYGFLILSLLHLILVTHYACVNITDFIAVTDSMPMLCQLLLCLLKVAIFLYKREEILLLIKKIHFINFKAAHEELKIVCRENLKDDFLCTVYLRLVIITGSVGVIHPVIYGLYVYFTSGEIVLTETNKASYFWDHSHLAGYSVLYVWNVCIIYFACVLPLAFDTLFSWFVSNIVAQFQILCYRFKHLGQQCQLNHQQFVAGFASCVDYHRQTLDLTAKLNHVYGGIIFVKFIIMCSEICSLVFRVSRPNDSLAEVAFKGLFLCSVAIELMLYCWNGQRIKNESVEVSIAIYNAFDWSSLPKSYKKLLLLSMMRSQRCIHVRGVFFEVDLSLYLWVFKTAGSLVTALKTLDENQD